MHETVQGFMYCVNLAQAVHCLKKNISYLFIINWFVDWQIKNLADAVIQSNLQ